MTEDREFDVILYGATGFTGRQTVAYFSKHAPPALRWAIAGRNQAKLEALQAGVPIITAGGNDQAQVDAMAARTRVVLTTAGPYALYGSCIVDACVRFRTHYVDITGEVVWVRDLIEKYHARAKAEGTRIIPLCGFDSAPADIGVWLLREALGNSLVEAKGFFQAGGGAPNGGTIASAQVTYSSGAAETGRDLFLLSPGMDREPHTLERDPGGIHFDRDVNLWAAPFPMSIIDTRVVRRSNWLLGTDVAYQEYVFFEGRLPALKAAAAALATSLFYTALRTPAVRNYLARKFAAGEGPSAQAMDNGWFRCRMWGRAADGRTAAAEMYGTGDPANRITVKCLCESAFALACNEAELPPHAGVVTPSVGLGNVLVSRLRDAGIDITASLAT